MLLGGEILLMEVVLDHLVGFIFAGVSLAMSSIGTAVYLYIKRKDEQMEVVFKELKTLKLGVHSILFDILTGIYSEKADVGYCNIEDRKKIEKLYGVYRKLGGNGTVEVLMEKLQELPTEQRSSLEKVMYAKDIRNIQ